MASEVSGSGRFRTYLGVVATLIGIVAGLLGILQGLHALGVIALNPAEEVSAAAAEVTEAMTGSSDDSGGASTAAQHELSVEVLGAPNGGTVTLPPDIVCSTQCTQGYEEGTQISLVAEPASGMRFIGWETGGQSSPCAGVQSFTCEFTITGDVAVTATFDI